MAKGSKKLEASEATWGFVVFSVFLIFLALFFLIETKVKPFLYFIFISVIAIMMGELVNYFFKREMLFFKVHVEYDPKKIWIQFERFLCLILDITIIVLLILYLFFNSQFFIVISVVNKNEVRGGIGFVLLAGLMGASFFWIHHFVKKWFQKNED